MKRWMHWLPGLQTLRDYQPAWLASDIFAGIVLATFIAAADRVGLGSCPISAIRNHAQQVSDILSLPDHVFPVAALGVGWPSFEGVMSPRLGLDVTIHRDRYDEAGCAKRSAPTTRGARRRSLTKPSATPINLARAPSTDGRRTRPGNIRCLSAPISALLCAARASGSTDLPLHLLQDIDPKGARKIGSAAAWRRPDLVDLRHQRVERQVASLRDSRQLLPELVLQRDARLMPMDGDRAFTHA